MHVPLAPDSGLATTGHTGRVLVWATDWTLGDTLTRTLAEAGHAPLVVEHDADLSTQHVPGVLLVAEYGPRLAAQQVFLRGPLILIDPCRAATRGLGARAYAVVGSVAAAGLAVDRFFEHRRLAERAAARQSPPGRCARCARVFDSRKAQPNSAACRFIRFGALSLCGSCVQALGALLRRSNLAVVDADR